LNAAGNAWWSDIKLTLPYHRFFYIKDADNIVMLWTEEELYDDPDIDDMDVP